MPLIQETLDRLVKAKYFTKLDLVAVFNKKKTGFRTRYGFFEFLVMNFGLCGTPSAFHNYINDILHEYMTFSSTTKWKKIETRSISFPKIAKTSLQIDIEKREYFVKKIKYLNLIKMDRKKTFSRFRLVNSYEFEKHQKWYV